MLARAAVAVTAGADFVVEGAVDLRYGVLACEKMVLGKNELRTLSCSVPKMEAR